MDLRDRKEEKRAWYQANQARILEHYKQHREVRQARSKAWSKAHPERKRANLRKQRLTQAGRDKSEHDSLLRRFREHGLTLDQYHSRMESQDFRCAICGTVPENNNYGGSHDGFHIDHSHVTGRVRGLLCDTCNVGIGMLQDSADICKKAAAYISTRL